MMTIKQFQKLRAKNKITSLELLQEMYKKYQQHKDLNIYREEYYLEAMERAKDNPDLIPFALKDVFFLKGKKCTAGSRMMEDFIAPFTSTVVNLLQPHCVFTGHTNTDEYTMGSSGKTCAYGPTKSPWKNSNGQVMSPGGSSSGSAACVAGGFALAALGTDTGGSVRQPAAWCGLFGLKPTYGLISRFGVVEMASSLDTVGVFAKTLEDTNYLFNIMQKYDLQDSCSVEFIAPVQEKKKILVLKNSGASPEVEACLQKAIDVFVKNGYQIQECKVNWFDYTIQIYYIISMVEVASNLSKYNGILYRKEGGVYGESRASGFGPEVIRRVLVGTELSQDDCKNYRHALLCLQVIWQEFCTLMVDADCLLMPGVPDVGLTMEQTLNNPDPTYMYFCDIYTCFVNLLGICGLSVPVELSSKTKTPLSVQLVGREMGDRIILKLGQMLDEEFRFNEQYGLAKLDEKYRLEESDEPYGSEEFNKGHELGELVK